jgi:tRNA nucleotidyltransferase (CCA-adding enzyme)
LIKQKLKNLLPLVPIINKLTDIGAICYLVGGCVRDLFLNKTSSDIDIEVHNISLGILQKELDLFSETILVGKQFGVLRMHKYNVDWSLPRTDSIGRRPNVSLDQNLTIERALERRDNNQCNCLEFI